VLVLAGCARPEDPNTFTFSYYEANPEQRAHKIKECTRDGGFAREDQTCINARAAHEAQDIGSFEDLPPMGLVPSEDDAKGKQEK
jgi:hypothetical protein